YAGPSALKYPRAASLATSQERLEGSGADPAKIQRQALSLQNKLKLRIVLFDFIIVDVLCFFILARVSRAKIRIFL
ncbi:MAG: hypothetical protein J6Z14_13955, partial [Prevotella sp.]|nr:hypothetical protein [Prevotella sp.]